MATITTRPDATVANGGSTVSGAASRHAALSDNNDSSYVVAGVAVATIGFAEPSIPAGGVVKTAGLRVRASNAVGSGVVEVFPSWKDTEDSAKAPSSITTFTISSAVVIDAADIVAITVGLIDESANTRLYELYVDTIYVAKPTLTVDSPTGTLTTDNAPAIGWTPSLDSDGGAQTFYEVRIFNDTQYGAGGFSAGSSAATVESGILAGNATSWDMSTIGELLPNDDYKAYVRVGQTVNGVVTWSNYTASSVFTINVPLPAVPTLALTDQGSTDQRLQIVATDPGGGAVTTDQFQIQRSDDGGTTWADIRSLLGGGLVVSSLVGAAAYDYEAENGASVKYRARALHGSTQFSAWSTVATGSWTSTKQGIKHPTDPTKNVEATFISQPGRRRAARQGVFQPIGASKPVVVSDVRPSASGELQVMVAEADLATFEALIEANVPLLVQAPATHKWTDRWVMFADVDFARFVDKSWVEEGQVSLPWVEVARPDGNLLSWT